MPAKRHLELTDDQRRELEHVVIHHPKPYVRERAAAILKVAAGQSGRAVAHHGLLQARRHGTVYAWLNRYEAEGVPGLLVKPGRGRKPAFFPSVPHARRRSRSDPARHSSGSAAV